MDPAREQANPREFIRLLMENERRIYAYIRTLLGNAADAEDVLQKTSVIMWDKFPEFDQGDNFIAWSFKSPSIRLRISDENKAARKSFSQIPC